MKFVNVFGQLIKIVHGVNFKKSTKL